MEGRVAHVRLETHSGPGPNQALAPACSCCFIWSRLGIGNSLNRNLADRIATADASGPFQWPLIDGMVAVNGKHAALFGDW